MLGKAPDEALYAARVWHGSHASARAKARNSSVGGPKWDEDRIRARTKVHVRVEEVRGGDADADEYGNAGDRYGCERIVQGLFGLKPLLFIHSL